METKLKEKVKTKKQKKKQVEAMKVELLNNFIFAFTQLQNCL